MTIGYGIRLKRRWMEELERLETALTVLEQHHLERGAVEKSERDIVQTVAHELRTPLTSVRESLSQIVEGFSGELTQPQHVNLDAALHEVDRLRRIVEEYLNIAKIEAGKVDLKRRLIPIDPLVRKVVSNFKVYTDHKKIKLTSSSDQLEVEAFVDSDKLVQILTNLIGNAIKFTEVGAVHVSVKSTKNEVEFCVEDSGGRESRRQIRYTCLIDLSKPITQNQLRRKGQD